MSPGQRHLLIVALWGAVLLGNAAAQMPPGRPEGIIVQVEGNLVYIDAGQSTGIMEGDLLDIMSADVLTHPLSGDTLAVTPVAVGALRVRQVFERLALAELIHLEPGQDPMLMPVFRIMDPDRMAQVMLYAQHYAYSSAAARNPRRLALVPGLYQLKAGSSPKGWVLLGAEAASLAAGIIGRIQSNNYYDNYHRLDSRYSAEEFDHQFERANTWRKRSNVSFWLAGALYAYNWMDVLWPGKGPAAPVSMGLSSEGVPLLQVARRF